MTSQVPATFESLWVASWHWMLTTLHEVWEYLTDNPLLLAAIVGGLITYRVARMTLHGVKISLAAATDRSKMELEHASNRSKLDREHVAEQAALERSSSANEARQERLTSIRRGVYLEAIKAIVKMNHFLATIPSRDLSIVAPDSPMMELANAANQVSAVGSIDTALKAREIAKLYSLLFHDAVGDLLPRGDLARKRSRLEERKSEVDRLLSNTLSALGELNTRLPRNEDAIARVNTVYEDQKQKTKDLHLKILDATSELSLMDLKYTDWLNDKLFAMNSKLEMLLNAIRLELELETDFDAFQLQSLATKNEIDISFKNLKAKAGIPVAA